MDKCLTENITSSHDDDDDYYVELLSPGGWYDRNIICHESWGHFYDTQYVSQYLGLWTKSLQYSNVTIKKQKKVWQFFI